MAGINSIGVGGMTHQQYSQATMNTAALGAQTTGTAKQQSSNIESQQNKLNDGVMLSDKATQSLNEDANEMQDEQFKEDQQQAKQSDNNESNLKQLRYKQNSGHAAMSFGAKSKDSEKSENKSSLNMPSTPSFSTASKKEEGGNTVRDDIQLNEDLNQAATLGILQEEARKLKSKQDDKNNIKQAEMYAKAQAQSSNGEFNGNNNKINSADIKIDTIKAEDINRVMNRTPEEILADIPQQFKATAQIMVAGQLDQIGQPKPTLVEIKKEPRAESALLELKPAEYEGEVIAEATEEYIPMSFDSPAA